ncbi:MAG: hypothetical protein U1E92_03900 [Moraxella osloensis]
MRPISLSSPYFIVVGEKAAIEQQLGDSIKTQGVPNYFGEQRFGQDANNIDAAIELFTHHTIRQKNSSQI